MPDIAVWNNLRGSLTRRRETLHGVLDTGRVTGRSAPLLSGAAPGGMIPTVDLPTGMKKPMQATPAQAVEQDLLGAINTPAEAPRAIHADLRLPLCDSIRITLQLLVIG